MKKVIKIDDNNMKQRIAIFRRFMTEINLWPRWRRVDYYNPIGLRYFYFTEVLEVFLRLFTDYGRAAIRQEERYADNFNLTLNFYLQYKESYNPRDHYQVYNEETLKALYFLDKIGVLDKWLKESPLIEKGQIRQKPRKDESRYRYSNRIRTEITPDIFL